MVTCSLHIIYKQRGNIPSVSSSNSEAEALELLENIEGINVSSVLHTK